MRCPSCGTQVAAGKKFCHACGARLELKCPSCGAAVDPTFRFCPDCGAAMISGEAAPAAPPADERLARLVRHIPEGLARKIRASTRSISGERKLVTVLFCDLVGSTAIAERLDPEEYRDLLDQYLEIAFREIYRFEGIVNQLAGDGMMTLFGAPIAHEDSPHRAIQAALAIREALAAFNRQLAARRGLELQLRIGINTGPVVVGTVGNDLKMDYTAIGDTTNLASRLQSLAEPGTILISEATHRLVRGFFDVRPVGPYEVKGKSDLVRAHEVIGLSDTATPIEVAEARGLTPLVGRSEELSQLYACYKRLAGGLPQVVAVVGDTGSGKSRLIYEFKRELAGEDVALFEARCSALSQNVPYAPFAGMLRQYFEIKPGEGAGCACDKIAQKVKPWDERLDGMYPLLCRLLSLPGDGLGERPADELKRDTFEAVARLVIGVSERNPVVMIFEDLHWIDDSSREMLALAVSKLQRARLMIVVTHRSDYQPAWRASAALTQLNLRRLADEEIAEIVRSVAGGTLPIELERQIVAKAEGSPFFAEEITRALVEEGDLTRDDGETRLTRPVEDVRIPGTVQEVIAARLDRLSPAAKRVVQVASVLGRQFHRDPLAELLAAESIDVRRELESLETRGILHRKDILSTEEYRFGESMTQEVAYESLLLRERRQLHERVACLLEAGPGATTAERSALLAHHFSRSDNRARAVEALLAAARDAEKLPSYRAAVSFYRQAWEAADLMLRGVAGSDEPLRRMALEAALSLCRLTIFYSSPVDPGDVLRAAQRGEELAQGLGDSEAYANLCALEGMITISAGRDKFAEGLKLVEKGLEAAKQAGLAFPAISISRGLAWSYLLDGRFAQAREKIDWVLQELERQGYRDRLADVYFGTAWFWIAVRLYGDEYQAALDQTIDGYELAIRASNRTSQSGGAATRAQIHLVRAEYAEAKHWADRSLEIARVIDNVSVIRSVAAIALLARVNLGEAVAVGRYVDLIDQGLEITGALPLSIRILTEAFLAVGEVRRAERCVELACQRAGGRLLEMFCAAAQGDVSLRLGPAHWEQAERSYQRALGLAEEVGSRSTRGLALVGLAELAAARGARQTGAQHLERAVSIFAELGLAHYRKRAEQALAAPSSGVPLHA